jgi:glutathione peroxidase-family protein
MFMKERATDAEVAEFAKSVNFPEAPKGILMSKGMVNGDSARPAWKLLKEATGAPDPNWNFAGNGICVTYHLSKITQICLR